MQNSKSLFCFGKKGNSWDFQRIQHIWNLNKSFIRRHILKFSYYVLLVYIKKVNIAFLHAPLLGENRALNYQFYHCVCQQKSTIFCLGRSRFCTILRKLFAKVCEVIASDTKVPFISTAPNIKVLKNN